MPYDTYEKDIETGEDIYKGEDELAIYGGKPESVTPNEDTEVYPEAGTYRKRIVSPDGVETWEQYHLPKVRPGEEALKMFEEKQQIKRNVYEQLGFDPDMDISTVSVSTALNDFKSQNGGMEPMTREQKAEVKSNAARIYRDLNYKKNDIERKAEDVYKMHINLQKQKSKQSDIQVLYERAKKGDMEAWNQLHQMQRGIEEESIKERKYKEEKEEFKQGRKRESKVNDFLIGRKKTQLTQLERKAMDTRDPEKKATLLSEAKALEKEIIEDLSKYDTGEEQPTKERKELDLDTRVAYLKKAGGDMAKAIRAAKVDGYDVR